MLNFLATLGMAGIGLVVLLVLIGVALSLTARYWRQLTVGAVALAILVILGVAGASYLTERSDRQAAEQRAQKQHEADVQMVRRQDERDKLRAKLNREWAARSEGCRPQSLTEPACMPIEFAIDRMKAFHAVELPAPTNPPPNIDVLKQYGVVWDAHSGEFKQGEYFIPAEDLAQAREKLGSTTPQQLFKAAADPLAAAMRQAIQDVDGASGTKDAIYRRQDNDGNEARTRVRESSSNPAN